MKLRRDRRPPVPARGGSVLKNLAAGRTGRGGGPCVGKGVQPIIGCQLALTRTDNPRLTPDPIVPLAQDAAGLANLQRLSSQGFLDTASGQKPQLPFDYIAQHAAGV